MEWSRLNWDLSFSTVIELKQILPKIGGSYPVCFDKHEDQAKAGTNFVLWLPPHSELNGLWDKRPSEILKAYVLKGKLDAIDLRSNKWVFRVEDCQPITSIFTEVEQTFKSPLVKVGLSSGETGIFFEDCKEVISSHFGDYIYVFGSAYEASYEVLMSISNNGYKLHYASYIPPCGYEAIILNYELTKTEIQVFNKVLATAKVINDSSWSVLGMDEVKGAEYW